MKHILFSHFKLQQIKPDTLTPYHSCISSYNNQRSNAENASCISDTDSSGHSDIKNESKWKPPGLFYVLCIKEEQDNGRETFSLYARI